MGAGVLGDGDEGGRADEALGGMLPADQGFGLGDVPLSSSTMGW